MPEFVTMDEFEALVSELDRVKDLSADLASLVQQTGMRTHVLAMLLNLALRELVLVALDPEEMLGRIAVTAASMVDDLKSDARLTGHLEADLHAWIGLLRDGLPTP